MDISANNLLALANMLKAEDEGSDDEEDTKPISASAHLGPGSIGPSLQQSTKKLSQKRSTKDIWEEDEVQEGAEYEDTYDPRPQPEYEFIFKQAVKTEDIFLQMGRKDPGTASCEDLKIKIHLPGTKYSDVDLDVKDTFLDCRCPKFKLGLHLPHPVDSKNGRAQWVADKETLIVTLKMQREYDFLNQ